MIIVILLRVNASVVDMGTNWGMGQVPRIPPPPNMSWMFKINIVLIL